MININEVPRELDLGNQLEYGDTVFVFALSSWQEKYPAIVCDISMMRPGIAKPYLVTGVSQAGSVLTWVVGNDATHAALPGTGSIVIRGLVEGVEKRSTAMFVAVGAGHPPAGETPEPVADWLRAAGLALASTLSAKDAANDAAALAAAKAGHADTAVALANQAAADAHSAAAGADVSAGLADDAAAQAVAAADAADTAAGLANTATGLTNTAADHANAAALAAGNNLLWRTTITGNPVACYPVAGSALWVTVRTVAQQSGYGDPTPGNVRPIAPAADAAQPVTVSITGGSDYALTVQQKMYGMAGLEDTRNNTGTETHPTCLLTLTGAENWNTYKTGEWTPSYIGARLSLSDVGPPSQESMLTICSHLTTKQQVIGALSLGINGFRVYVDNLYMCIGVEGVTDLATLKAWLAAQNTAGMPVQVLYVRAASQVLSVSSVSINGMAQTNRTTPRLHTISTSAGAVDVEYAKSPIQESNEVRALLG